MKIDFENHKGIVIYTISFNSCYSGKKLGAKICPISRGKDLANIVSGRLVSRPGVQLRDLLISSSPPPNFTNF